MSSPQETRAVYEDTERGLTIESRFDTGSVTLGALAFGIGGFGTGKMSPRTQNKMMRLRIIAQFTAVVIMIMSGFILFDTSRMVNGGETNYIRATVGLYLSIFNIFIHLLNLLGALSGRE